MLLDSYGMLTGEGECDKRQGTGSRQGIGSSQSFRLGSRWNPQGALWSHHSHILEKVSKNFGISPIIPIFLLKTFKTFRSWKVLEADAPSKLKFIMAISINDEWYWVENHCCLKFCFIHPFEKTNSNFNNLSYLMRQYRCSCTWQYVVYSIAMFSY